MNTQTSSYSRPLGEQVFLAVITVAGVLIFLGGIAVAYQSIAHMPNETTLAFKLFAGIGFDSFAVAMAIVSRIIIFLIGAIAVILMILCGLFALGAFDDDDYDD